MSEAILDEKIFQRFCKILKKKAFLHIDSLCQECDKLVEEIHSKEWETVLFSAHKLKSSAGQIGAKALAAQIGQVENNVSRTAEGGSSLGEEALLVQITVDLESLIAQTNAAFDLARSTLENNPASIKKPAST